MQYTNMSSNIYLACEAAWSRTICWKISFTKKYIEMVNLAGHSGQSLPTCTDHWYVRGCQTNMSSNIYLAHHRRHLEFLLFVTNCLWQKYKNTNRNGQPGRPVPSHMHWPHLPSFPGCFHVSSSSSNNVQICKYSSDH